MFSSRSLLSMSFAAFIAVSSSLTWVGSAHAEEPIPLKQADQIIAQQNHTVTKKAKVLDSTSQQLKDLQTQKETLAQKVADDQKAVEDLRQKVAQKAAEKQAAEAKAAQPAPQPAPQPVASGNGPRSGCGDNQYAAYIYGRESGGTITGNCNPSARNSGGCLGIGQACPGSKLLAVCPNLDYDCENAFFTNYAISRYGSWASAYSAWLSQGWW